MDFKDKDKVGVSETPHSGSEKQEVEAWLRTIEATVKWRDGIGNKSGWKRFVNEYKNNWDFLQSSVSIPLIPVNLVYAYTKTEIARLYFKDPWITVNAKRVEDLGAAQIAEQIINYTWGELKLKSQIKLALMEALLVGHSWIKIGYAAEFGTVESQPKEEKRSPGRPKKFKEVETNEYIKSESVFAYQVSYKDVIFDPSATFPATSNARWMAHKVVKPYRAIVQSGIYEHTDELKPNVYVDDPNVPYDTPDSLKEGFGKDVRSVVLWEIYDLDHQTVTTVSPGCIYKLREILLPEYLNGGFPFIMLAFNPVPGDVYPMSDIAPQEGQIIELTKILSLAINHLKRWNRQMIVDADAFTPDEAAKFKDANDGAIIQAQQPGVKDKIFIPPYPPVQSDVYGVWNWTYDIWRSVAGQTQTDQGGQAKTQTRTLGELRMALQGGKARSDEKVDTLEDVLSEVARKLLFIIQKKYDLPKIARIVGPKAVQEKILKILPKRPSVQPNMPQPGAQVPGALPQGTQGSLTQGPMPPGEMSPGSMPQGSMLPGMSPPPLQPNPVAQSSYQNGFGFSWNRTDIIGEMDVDVLAGSTVPMDRESMLEVMEKLAPFLQLAGVTPGSPAAKAYFREFIRLIGIMSVESIMDQIEEQPQIPPPKIMETQAKIQGKMAETKMKIQGKAQEEAIKIQALKEKLHVDRVKNEMQMQKGIMDSILKQFRQPVNGGFQNGGQNGSEI